MDSLDIRLRDLHLLFWIKVTKKAIVPEIRHVNRQPIRAFQHGCINACHVGIRPDRAPRPVIQGHLRDLTNVFETKAGAFPCLQ